MLFLAIYLLGAIICYFPLRYISRKNHNGSYTIGEKFKVIGMCLYSWLMALAIAIGELYDWYERAKDREAKW